MDPVANRTCLKCGWVHFGVTREDAEANVESFNRYYDRLPSEEQEQWYGGHCSTIEQYEKCFCCGGDWKNFRDEVEGDCPIGCTIQPIIYEA